MGRSPCCKKDEVNRGSWSAQEDKILENFIKAHGEGKWRDVAKRAGLNRCGKSCRLRWLNYLRPGIKRGNISQDEEDLIIKLHMLLGNRWSLIAGRLPGRTDNEIKNYWNSYLSKRLADQQTQKRHNNKPKNSGVKPTAHTKTSAIEFPSQVIRTKASKCAKVVLPMQAAMDSAKLASTLVNSYNHCNGAENEMNLVREGIENQYSSMEDFSDLLLDFSIGDLLIPDAVAGQPCSSGKKKDEMIEQYYYCGNNIVDERDQNGQSNNMSVACVDLSAHSGDKANDKLDDLLVDGAGPENWMDGEFFQANEIEMDLTCFLNLEK